MHWLEEFRRNYRKKNGCLGITEEELAHLIATRNTGCSKKLIEILEAGGITHPAIADRIAAFTGATQEQRDSLVHKKHRGKKFSGKKKKQNPQAFTIKPMIMPANARTVVQISESGMELQRFESINMAAREVKCSSAAVHRRCHGDTWINFDEFASFGCTFRFADEWDAMDAEERIKCIRAAGARVGRIENGC